MNADGQPALDVDADLGARIPALPWIALAVLLTGAVFAAAGGAPDRGGIPQAHRIGGAMTDVKEAAAAFLANKRVAVTGVSRTPKTHGSNTVYKRLRERGYEVFAVNPNADEVEGDRSYPI